MLLVYVLDVFLLEVLDVTSRRPTMQVNYCLLEAS